MEKVPVSVVVIAKNEEKQIADCLATVTWAKEIVLLDDMSTDRTVEIATRFTDKIFRRKMDIEGRHRNFAYSLASQDWVFSLDADERVTPELAAEIARTLQKAPPEVVCYAVPFKNFLGPEWIRGAGYYPAYKDRLFRKGQFRYEEAGVHPRVLYEGRNGVLKHEILHYSVRDLSHWIEKFNRETTLEAEKWIEDKRKVSLANSLRKYLDRFLKNYFLKGGWKTGFLGFLMSVFHGLYQLITYAKYRELKGMTAKEKTG